LYLEFPKSRPINYLKNGFTEFGRRCFDPDEAGLYSPRLFGSDGKIFIPFFKVALCVKGNQKAIFVQIVILLKWLLTTFGVLKNTICVV